MQKVHGDFLNTKRLYVMPPMPLFYFGVPSRTDAHFIMAQIAALPPKKQQAIANEYNETYLKHGPIISNESLKKTMGEHGGVVPVISRQYFSFEAQLIISTLPPGVRQSAVDYHKKVFEKYGVKNGHSKGLEMLKAALKKHKGITI